MIDPTLPLVELHRHLEGSVRLETILDLGRRHNLPLPAWERNTLRPYVQVIEPQPGVMAFIERFKWAVGVMVDYDACRRIAYENVLDAHSEGLDYLELRFSPWFMAEPHRLDLSAVVEAVIQGVEQASQDSGLKVNLIGILSRTYGPQVAWSELNALLHWQDHIVGLDLAGDEANYPGSLFIDHFRKARQAGWQITIHAGESAGAESVWQAIHELGASRIGHAVHALDDPHLLDVMLERRVGVEASLTSNVQTSTVADYASHPLRRFMECGLLASLNTDDPAISGIDLHYEYEVAAPAAGLSQAQIGQLQQDALQLAFLSPTERDALRSTKS